MKYLEQSVQRSLLYRCREASVGPSIRCLSMHYPVAAAVYLDSHHRTTMYSSRRSFGNAPSRIRPVEVPEEHAWRQSEREISAFIVIVVMMILPLWLFVLSAESRDHHREEVRRWALEQRRLHSRYPAGDSPE